MIGNWYVSQNELVMVWAADVEIIWSRIKTKLIGK